MLRPRSGARWPAAGVALLLISPDPIGLRAAPPAQAPNFASRAESFEYSIQWRIFSAGAATLKLAPDGMSGGPHWRSDVHLESTGVIATFFRLRDDYQVKLEDEFCALSSVFLAQEGKRNRETRVNFDRDKGMATFVEKDRVKGVILHAGQTSIPACVSDVVGGLYRLRALHLDVGQTTRLPLSDGKKSAQVRVEAQGREEIVTKLGKFKTIRYEANLFNGVLYSRRAQVQIWLSDDARRLPVQFQIRLPIVIGTITLQLEKENAA